jgi:hypothetical protein
VGSDGVRGRREARASRGASVASRARLPVGLADVRDVCAERSLGAAAVGAGADPPLPVVGALHVESS